MAERLRGLLAGQAVPGWENSSTSARADPVRLLVEPLLAVSAGHRFYNLLDRNGFAPSRRSQPLPTIAYFVSTKAARRCSRQFGLCSVTWAGIYRSLLTRPRPTLWSRDGRTWAADWPRLSAFGTRNSSACWPAHRCHFGLDKIIDSLNAEVVPLADPLVCLLLETAGEAEMASYYQHTHSQPSTSPDSL